MFERSLLAASVAAVAMSSALSPVVSRAQRADPTMAPFVRRGNKLRPCSGAGACKLTDVSSLKKRMRHARRNEAIEPGPEALRRHPWYRRQVAREALMAL